MRALNDDAHRFITVSFSDTGISSPLFVLGDRSVSFIIFKILFFPSVNVNNVQFLVKVVNNNLQVVLNPELEYR